MIPAAFSYTRPADLAGVLEQLATGGPGVKVLAGGQSLIPLLRLRLASAETLVDIGGLSELRSIRELPDGGLGIGATVTYREVLDSDVATTRIPLLALAIQGIGDVQVRNRGTLVGSIAHADPASDMPAIVLALEATLAIRSKRGERVVAVADFFQGPFATGLEDDELVTELRIPGPPTGAGMAYRRLEQRASGYSIAGVAAVVGRSAGSVTIARVGITGVGDAAYRAAAVESALMGTSGDAAAIATAAAHATDGISVASDIHAGAEYRAEMARVHTRRAIEAALAAGD